MIRSDALKGLIALFFLAVILADVLTATTPVEQFFSTKKIEELSLLSDENSTEDGKFAIKTNLSALPKREDDKWKAFEQTIGTEKVLMHLPDQPVFTRVNDNWGATIALEGKIEYWLMAPVPAMSGVKEEHLFPMFMEMYSKKPYKLIESNITEENGLPILEITARNRKTRKIEVVRIIVSDENFYVASMKFPKRREIK